MIASTHARRISFIGTRRDHVPPARDAVVRVARSWGIDPTSLGDIALVADELLANAVIHAPGRLLVGIYLSPDGDRVVIEVYDPSRRMPTGAANFGNDELTTGRGMLLIEGLSEIWGAEPTTHGKKVWAELAVPAVAVPEHPRSARRAALIADLVTVGDALAEKPSGRHATLVLANPPFGRKSAIAVIGQDGEVEKEDVQYDRDDFTTTTTKSS
ncbi:ATP-binding protein [Kitasatospora sp. NPDC052896]|uniref:ATP-binding protein n=1 Tax=Kitasatospora sp. NPDC052896 TaxID=3364061 RepID=UPI0037C726C2